MDYTVSIFALGDSAFTIDFGNTIEKSLNKKVLALSEALHKQGLPGIKDIVPAYSSITVHYDITAVRKSNPNASFFEDLQHQLASFLENQASLTTSAGRKIRIPVCYSSRYALDISEVAAHAKATIEEVIHLHSSKTYRVFMVGFLPGFAYMGEVDEQIAVPRKHTPRLKIPAGSVGIAGKQTGIYPLTSPGGWQIVGRTPVKLFDKNKAEPVLFKAGDEVEFYSISEDEFDNY